jgi:hypothetical protein
VFVIQPPTVDEPEKLPSKIRDRAALTVFRTASLQSGPTTEIPDEPFAMALSTDEQWAYILDRGYHNHFSVPHLSGAGIRDGWVNGDNKKNHRDGVLHVFETVTAIERPPSHSGLHPGNCWLTLLPTASRSWDTPRMAFTAVCMSFAARTSSAQLNSANVLRT